jgi:hypothetical protein
MLSVSHGTTGAFIASKIPNPFISIPLVLASHFLEDKVPHWDVGQGLTKKTKSKKSAFYQELFIDFPLSIAIVFFFFQFNRPFNPLPWIGWFVALLPDFLEFPRNFLGYEPFFLKPINKFHHHFHHSTPKKLVGLTPQILLLLAIFFLR